jgi:hypothetical protein
MNQFKPFFHIELQRFFRKPKIIMVLFFYVVAFYLVQTATGHYKSLLRSNDAFVNYEKSKTSAMRDYTQYANVGIYLQLSSSPASILFFNSGRGNDVTGRTNGATINDLSLSIKGRNFFPSKIWNANDLSGWLILVGSLSMLFFGYLTFMRMQFYKMLTCHVSVKRIFLFTAGSRLIIAGLLSIGVIIMSLFLVSINGILLTPADYIDISIFTLILLFTLTFFFLIGILIGYVKSKARGITVIFIVWLIMIYLLPSMLNELGKTILTQIPTKGSTDKAKWDLIVDFEKRGSEELGGYRPDMIRDEHFRRVLESYFPNEDTKIHNIEKSIGKKFEEAISFAQAFNFLIPTTFYNSITGELSGRGVENVNEFFNYILSFRLRFQRYFLYKKHYSGDKKVESFVKKRENVFTSSIRLPGNFISGTIVLVLYVVILGFACYLRFRKALFHVSVPKSLAEPIQVKVRLKKGEFGAFVYRHHCMVDLSFSMLSGKYKWIDRRKINGDLEVLDMNLIEDWQTGEFDFQFFCSPEDLPGDIRPEELATFFCALLRVKEEVIEQLLEFPSVKRNKGKLLADLSLEERSRILLMLAKLKQSKLYLLHNTSRWMGRDLIVRFQALIEELTSRGAGVLIKKEGE